jgi:hypothetical protein
MLHDSRVDIWQHIHAVRVDLDEAIVNLMDRALQHDRSKLSSPERESLDRLGPQSENVRYGSSEYEQQRQANASILEEHYAKNRHHPEHWKAGIQGMSLLDLLEMLADWHAATCRDENSDLLRSIAINQERFGYSDELRMIFENTAREMGWRKWPEPRIFDQESG